SEPPQNSLWKLMQATYQLLNVTRPNLTEHCWLCYMIKSPFYEAGGISEKARHITGNNPAECNWKDPKTPGITLTSVTRQGKCVG
ncbi:ENV2 protein, partial [Certhia brachydactyla]|nr:ENV2 protein [Certhia brachydactyla]